jgi:predicted Zn-dependent protease
MKRNTFALLLATALIAAGCSTNAATGQRQLTLISEAQEVQMGAQAAQGVVQQMGLYENAEIQSYVNSVGKEIAAKSERPDLPWEFRVIDDPMINAFALPGGYIFLTRGILSHFNNEAEMASVLGHEIGHVTARHSVEQMSKAQLANLGFGLAMILGGPQVQQFGDIAQMGLQLMFLKFGRDDERQSDDLGLRYMTNAGYDPKQAPAMFGTLSQISKLEGGGRVPEWASTHPDPENRAARLQAQIAELPTQTGRVDEAEYLRRLDGMVFGVNPREGYTIGSTFIHPDLQFRMTFPRGWKINNMKQAVVGVSPNNDAAVQLSTGQGSTPEQAARAFFSQQGIQAQSEWRPGIYTFSTAQTQQGQSFRGLAGFVQHRGAVLQIVGYTPAGNWNRAADTLANAVASFEPETRSRYINVSPKRIEIVKVPRRMTLQEFARAYPSSVDLQTLAVANGAFREDFVFQSGDLAKRIVGGDVPES